MINKLFIFNSQNGKTNVLRFLRKITKRPDLRLSLYAYIQQLFWRLKYPKSKYLFYKRYQPIAPSNSYYGHEYWLKKYSGFSGKIYAHIEHGIYLGRRDFVANEEEWLLGNIITFGERRVKLLQEICPKSNVFQIGPRLHYADMDEAYYRDLKSKLKQNTKTIVLYPSHSLGTIQDEYNVDQFIDDALAYAVKIGAGNLLVSIHPNDYNHGLEVNYKNYKLKTVSGGKDSINFLPRLKAIMAVADVIYTNSLGTHVGYGLYMGKPVVMNLKTSPQKSLINREFADEQLKFGELFNENSQLKISKEQFELADYYFGLSKVKSPEELYDILIQCREKYDSIYNRRKS